MSKKLRDVTGCFVITDKGGDDLVVYNVDIATIGVGVQRREQERGYAATLDAARLDRLIAELQDRRARMPGS